MGIVGSRPRMIMTLAVVMLLSSACTSDDGPTQPSPGPTIDFPTASPSPTVGSPTPQPTPTSTFTTDQAICPPEGWSDATRWIALPIEITVPAEAAIGTEVGLCANDTGERTYLVNYGNTAWTIASPPVTIEHYYIPGAPPLLFAVRQSGQALNTLGPHEEALIESAPTTVSWSIDMPATLTTSTVGAMTDEYGAQAFTSEALDSWEAASDTKGSASKVLAVCANATFGIATSEWSAARDVDTALANITTALQASSGAVGCTGAVVEFDEARQLELGEAPRLSTSLKSQAFTVAGERLTVAEKATGLLTAVVKYVK